MREHMRGHMLVAAGRNCNRESLKESSNQERNKGDDNCSNHGTDI